ncbi:hypothetical protein Afil01_32920 [Actinorhabdospora filicis]|uniref:EF-hand domain-containing protein n=1 Tax=Actinorhabdospora filicis TaxID=1785913 RepID=A0A9W6WB91_9ACTN|nr:EF-hand domain-containing protein [Actinorhabdospora filicis]GLZ78485.1 hypothetical protein Afil01_32920 [Actinorhabdospora filicis]
MTDAIAQRLRARFELLDVDGDGRLRHDDFTAAADRVAARLGLTADDPKTRTLHQAMNRFWAGLREHADADGDGTVTLAEYAAVAGDPAGFDAHVADYARAMVGVCDRDNDGVIGRQEFLDGLNALGFAPDGAALLHESLAEPDGSVPAEAWVRSIRAYYLDPADASPNLLLHG